MIISVYEHQQLEYELDILDEDIQNGAEIFLGREEDCHIKLDSFLISRYHAKVFQSERGIELEVLSDYGGVKSKGTEVTSLTLNEGDKIKISDYEIIFKSLPQVIVKNLEQETPELEEDTELQNNAEESLEEHHDEEPLLDTQGQIKQIMDETVQIPDDLEQMMQEDPPVEDDFSETDLVDDDLAAETIIEEDFEPNLEEDLNAELGDTDLFAEENQEVLEANFDSELEGENDDFEEEFNNDQEDTEALTDAGEDDDGFGTEGFQEDNFNDGGFDETEAFSGGNDTGATQVLQSFAKYKLKIFGEYAPFDSYEIVDNETNIGRDPEKCQIVLNDPEVSKIHAVIKKTLVSCTLMDNESSNGIICNGERTQRVELTNGDEFLIGDTTFTVEIISDIIEAEKDVLMPVEQDQEVEIEEIVEEEVDFDSFDGEAEFGGEEQEKSFLKRIWKDKKKRMYLIAGVLAFVFLVMVDSESPKKVEEKDPKTVEQNKKDKDTPKFDAETLEKLEQNYALALAKFEEGEYSEAKEYIDIVMTQAPDYKDSKTLSKLIDEGIAEIERLKAKEAEEKERRERQIEINALVEKAKGAVKERNVLLSRELFSQILEKDPENLEVPSLKLEIDAWEEEEKRKKMEEQLAKAKRQAMVDKLKPGKSAYLQGEWYQASEKLDKFIKEKDIDEDLIKEASQMLKESKQKLVGMINPLISKARSFKEGQDLKQAYETYGEVLKYDPTNEEALNERDVIFRTLHNRSKKVYREALIAESLSLFPKAKEKFQEVQQISPINSEYYNKATDKLKNYLE